MFRPFHISKVLLVLPIHTYEPYMACMCSTVLRLAHISRKAMVERRSQQPSVLGEISCAPLFDQAPEYEEHHAEKQLSEMSTAQIVPSPRDRILSGRVLLSH